MVGQKQDSNQVGLYMVREVNGAIPANPVFETREPNTFSKFGGEYKRVARSPITPDRSMKKGTVSDLDTSGDFNEDVTQNNTHSMLEGFFFAAMRRKPSTFVTGVVSPDNTYAGATAGGIPVGSIVHAFGFAKSANNGAKHVTGVNGGVLTVAEPLASEPAPPATAKVTRVGNRFAAGDASLAIEGGMAVLVFAAFDPSTIGLIPGEWVFVGGDAAATQFANTKPFYARVNNIDVANRKIYFDKTTSVVVAEVGAPAQTIELYYGYLIKNEDDPSLIMKSTFTLERPLGKDDVGIQSDNLQHYVFNTLKWNSPLSNKVTIDVTGIGLYYGKRTGTDGMLSKQPGAIVKKALSEEAFNTSMNVFRSRLSIIDPTTLNPSPLFARITEWSSTINNGVTASKAQGLLGGFDTSVGNFGVTLTMTAYFTTIAAVQAIEDNSDCTYDVIYAKKNAAIIHDYPIISLGGGELTVAQNQPIMLPLTNDASQSPFGHTLLINFLPYIPSVGMAKGG